MSPNPDLLTVFLRELGKKGELEAKELLSSFAFPHGVDQAPSPRARALVESGEWEDTSKLLPVRYVDSTCCFGVVRGDGYERFCGKSECSVAAHSKSLLPQEDRRTGYYIAMGTSNGGVLKEFYFPKHHPLTGELIATREADLFLLDATDPFKLTLGQWRFLLNEYRESLVVELANLTPSSESEQIDGVQQKPLFVDTGAAVQSPKALLREVISSMGEPDDASRWEAKFEPVLKAMEEREKSQVKMEKELGYLREEMQSLAKMHQEFKRVVEDRVATFDVSGLVRKSDSEWATYVEHSQKAYAAACETRLPNLTKQVQELVNRVPAGGHDYFNLTFDSAREFARWFEREDRASVNLGAFVDAFALLNAIAPPVQSKQEATKEMEGQAKIDINNDLEANVIMSFKTKIPAIMVGYQSSSKGGALASLKSYLKSYHDWKPKAQREGPHYDVYKGVPEIVSQVTLLLRDQTSDPQVHALAGGLLNQSVAFINQLLAWIEATYNMWCAANKDNSKLAWEMILECLAHVFGELSTARQRYAATARAQGSPALYIWGMLQAYDVQERYMKNDFGDDPALTGILVRRLMTATSMDSDAGTRVDELKKAVDDLSKTSNTQSSQIRNMGNRIQKLEDKK